MKKIGILLLAFVLLVGCSATSEPSYITSIPNGDETAVVANDITVTNDDIYHYLLDNLGAATVLEQALLHIAEIEVTDEDLIEEGIASMVSEYEAYMDMTIDEYAVSQGYPDGDTYIDEVIRASAMNELLTTLYVEDNFDDLVSDYKVKYLKVVTFDTESEALTALESVSSVSDFDTLVDEYEGSDYGICTTESYIDSNIVATFDEFTADGLYSSAIETSDGKYAIVYVYNTDLTGLESDVTDALLYMSSVITLSEVYYLTSYEFSVYEGIIYDAIEAYGSDYLG